MSSGFRPRWMDCDEPGWNPDSRRDSTAEPEQASDRMALALPSECIVYPIRYTMHVNAEGSERDRKSASLLDGKTESDTPLVLTTMTEESSTFILVSFDDDSYLIIDERSSGVLQIEHASDDAYARIVLGAYEEGATHQLWRFEPTGHGSYYLVSEEKRAGCRSVQLPAGGWKPPYRLPKKQRMEPAVPFRLRRHPGYGSLHLAGRG